MYSRTVRQTLTGFAAVLCGLVGNYKHHRELWVELPQIIDAVQLSQLCQMCQWNKAILLCSYLSQSQVVLVFAWGLDWPQSYHMHILDKLVVPDWAKCCWYSGFLMRKLSFCQHLKVVFLEIIFPCFASLHSLDKGCLITTDTFWINTGVVVAVHRINHLR